MLAKSNHVKRKKNERNFKRIGVVTIVTDRLDSPFLCKGPSSTSVKLFLVFRLNLNCWRLRVPET
jgi:hypothetical protein